MDLSALDKGKPAARQGRKAMGLGNKAARPPKEQRYDRADDPVSPSSGWMSCGGAGAPAAKPTRFSQAPLTLKTANFSKEKDAKPRT